MKDLKKTLYLGLGLGVKLLAGLYAVKICAQYLGPESFGMTGQLSSLLSLISLLAGAGVSVGITKVYAGSEFSAESRPDWLRAARMIVLTSACVLSILLLLTTSWVSEHLFSGFGSANWLLIGLVSGIFPIAYSAIGLGRINGSHRNETYAISLILGSMLGLFGLWCLGYLLGPVGALLGMIWLPVAQALTTIFLGSRIDHFFPAGYTNVDADVKAKIKFLLGYGMLSITAGAIIPITYIFIRLLIQQYNSDLEFGLWQATSRISEAYNQLPLMLLSVVLFPRFASTASEPLTLDQIRRTYIFMAAIMVGISGFVYLTRTYWINLVFTADFAPMDAFVPWQLAGDSLKILSFLGTTILASRGAVKLCIYGEFLQGFLLIITGSLLIPQFPMYGIFYAYILSYMIYFIVTIVTLMRFNNKYYENTYN